MTIEPPDAWNMKAYAQILPLRILFVNHLILIFSFRFLSLGMMLHMCSTIYLSLKLWLFFVNVFSLHIQFEDDNKM